MPVKVTGKKITPFSEEDVCIVSKRDPCVVWAGTKVLYSGIWASGPQQASGFNYKSGETDVEPVNVSGWGEIRIPELNQLHKLFVFPKPCWIMATPDFISMPAGYTAESGIGGCSGKVAKLKWCNYCASGQYGHADSGSPLPTAGPCSGQAWPMAFSGFMEFNSGLVDVIAFGSEY